MKRRDKLDQELPQRGRRKCEDRTFLRGGVSRPAHTKETPGWRDLQCDTRKHQIHHF